MNEREESTDEQSLTRHEEEIAGVDTPWRGIGHVRARKRVITERVREDVPRDVETVELRREPATAEDSGKIETLPDGSISIPVYEEELVVTKRRVLRERVIVHKQTVTERQRVRAELRKERVSVDADDGVTLAAEHGDRTLSRNAMRARNAETRPFFVTSEFLAAAAVAVALVVAALATGLDTRIMLALLTVIVGAYVLARGFAKARTPHGYVDNGGHDG